MIPKRVKFVGPEDVSDSEFVGIFCIWPECPDKMAIFNYKKNQKRVKCLVVDTSFRAGLEGESVRYCLRTLRRRSLMNWKDDFFDLITKKLFEKTTVFESLIGLAQLKDE